MWEAVRIVAGSSIAVFGGIATLVGGIALMAALLHSGHSPILVFIFGIPPVIGITASAFIGGCFIADPSC